jgi:hypothetical protein
MTIAVDDNRELLVLAQALTFAIEGLKTLPQEYRPESNIRDMQRMLREDLGNQFNDLHLAVEHTVDLWLAHVAWNVRNKPPA